MNISELINTLNEIKDRLEQDNSPFFKDPCVNIWDSKFGFIPLSVLEVGLYYVDSDGIVKQHVCIDD